MRAVITSVGVTVMIGITHSWTTLLARSSGLTVPCQPMGTGCWRRCARICCCEACICAGGVPPPPIMFWNCMAVCV